MSGAIAFVTYETRFAPCGGIAAAMSFLPGAVHAESGVPTCVITPYHRNLAQTASLEVALAGEVVVPAEGTEVRIRVLRHDGEWPWYFLAPDDARYFAGHKHPYDLGPGVDGELAPLMRDALLFGSAAARALEVIHPRVSWTLMLQDWEAATVALALAGRPHTHLLSLTIHNTYDSPISDEQLRHMGIDPATCAAPLGDHNASILERTMPLVVGPVFTVSPQFATDITEDVLQTQVMTPHLQPLLQGRLHGVNNGVFVPCAVPKPVLSAGNRGEYGPIREWKRAQRSQAVAALARLQDSATTPVWGDPRSFVSGADPWCVMAGRDDPRQKGYDVAALAIRAYLEGRRDARFLFFPIPGDEGLPGLTFLRRLAETYPDRVLVLPFIWREGFQSALRGAAYGLMPSLYEPFGMANEFYLNGTVGIGRATGGIVEQIVPLRDTEVYTAAVAARATRFHAAGAAPTGILYREGDEQAGAVHDWAAVNAARYDARGGEPDRAAERSQYPLVCDMANLLARSVEAGIQTYRESSDTYAAMLLAGIRHIQQHFTWQAAAAGYLDALHGHSAVHA